MQRPVWLGFLLVFLASGCPLPELGGEGQECFEPPDQCNGGLTCIEGICIRPECTRPQDCPQGQYCDQMAFECLDGCDHGDQCEPGDYCDLTEHQCKRDPDAPAQLGEPCNFTTDFGTAHPQANNCELDLRCMGFGVEGGMGYCPGQSPEECWMVREVYNRDCVNGSCSGSFCCALCSSGNCPAGYEPLELRSGDCVCLPLPQSADCHPLEPSCPSGEKCVPSDALDTRCIPIGYVGPGQSCEPKDNQLCQVGYMCLGSGEDYNCEKLCDMNDSSTCEAGFYCATISNIERWGYCNPET